MVRGILLATPVDRIVNHRSGRAAIPAWFRPALLPVPVYAAAAVIFWMMAWALPDLSLYWLAAFWTVYAAVFAVGAWAGRITAVEVGPDLLAVKHPIRSRIAALHDVLRVDAHRVPWRVFGSRQPPVYRIDVWLTGFRHWRLDNIEPEAGDRLLATLDARRKPIWVFASS